ncbi:YhfG family protein [Pseudomonadota bacterium]
MTWLRRFRGIIIFDETGEVAMKQFSLQAKIAHFEKTKLKNYKASMRLEGIKSVSSGPSGKAGRGLTREEILEKYSPTK